ncbi:hypothetical protein R80B4_01884 [Fibrobacteres bacterium R8-0-B4]
MDNSTITLLIRYFNILSATIMAFFAIYGAIAVFGKKSNLNIFRRNIFIQAFCVAALFAFALEATVCNFPHYLKYFADGETYTLGISQQDSTIILTSDGTRAETFIEHGDSASRASTAVVTAANSVSGSGVPTADTSLAGVVSQNIKDGKGDKGGNDSADVWGGVVFKKLDRRVTSVFVNPVFDNTEWINAIVKIKTKDWGESKIAVKTLVKGLPHTNYIQIQPFGEITELKVMLSGAKSSGASQIALNRQIPLYFSGLRLIAVTLLFFALILFAYRPLRAKISYLLFDYKFDPSNRTQNVVFILAIVSLILFSWICAYTSITEDEPQAQQYNKYLVDAVFAGRTHLEAGNPEKMQYAPNPYDLNWLDENKYVRRVDWFPDWVYYKGKFYCYFGIVPALVLYVPYTLITGNYLSNHGGIFIFAAISIILLARLWRFFVRKYMPDMRFVFYLLSFLTLFFASGWFCPLRFTRFYSIVSAGGFMFVIAGILLIFESVEREKPDLSKLFFACLCLALAVGCRPTLLFASLIVPVILWKHKLWKQLPLIAIPYLAVAIPLCMYNYDRFGSIFDFGFDYNMTNLNSAEYRLLNPIGKGINTLIVSISYLFSVNRYSFFFPYVESIQQHDRFFWAIARFYDKGYGMINYPIVFCLFFFFKSILIKEDRPKTFYISGAFLAIAAVLILANSWLAGFSGRYSFDFAIFIILPSLFCAYQWCSGSNGINVQALEYQARVRQKVTYILLTLSIFVGLFLFATTVTNDATPFSPVLYLYLRQSLILLGIV